MIEKFEGIKRGSFLSYDAAMEKVTEKMNELADAVNALTMRVDRHDDQLDDHGSSLTELEDMLYGCDDDDDCGDDCEETIEAMLDGDLCPDCRFDALLDTLDTLDDDQLQVVRSEA